MSAGRTVAGDLVAPFSDNKVDIVAGVYRALWETDFQYFQGLVVIPCVAKMHRISRMSSRSLAFRKKCWEEVGGYPEQYDMGEDTYFNMKLRKRGYTFFLAENAIVRWQMRKSWKSLFRQYYQYGAWDRVSGNILGLKDNLAMVCCFWGLLLLTTIVDVRFVVFMVALLIVDLILSAPQIFREKHKVKAFLFGMSIDAVRRIAYITGATFGRTRRI